MSDYSKELSQKERDNIILCQFIPMQIKVELLQYNDDENSYCSRINYIHKRYREMIKINIKYNIIPERDVPLCMYAYVQEIINNFMNNFMPDWDGYETQESKLTCEKYIQVMKEFHSHYIIINRYKKYFSRILSYPEFLVIRDMINTANYEFNTKKKKEFITPKIRNLFDEYDIVNIHAILSVSKNFISIIQNGNIFKYLSDDIKDILTKYSKSMDISIDRCPEILADPTFHSIF